jgi:hypothetical protein
MLEQQGPEEWEKGLSNVQLTPDGSIIPVHATHSSASKLMPVEEDDSDDEVRFTLHICMEEVTDR